MKNKKGQIISFMIIFLITCVVFIPFLKGHYATDTYNIIDRGYKDYAIKYSINDGRIFMGLISLFADKIRMPIKIYIITLTFLAIFTSCICVMLIRRIISNYREPQNLFEDIILTLICYSVIWNFMYLENMQFAECFVMSLSILFYIIAADILTKKQKKYFIKSLLLTVLGTFSYQGTLGFLPIMVLVITLIKKDNDIIKNIFYSGIMCIIACILNVMQIKIFSTIMGLGQKVENFQNILVMLFVIINKLKGIFIYTASIFPKYLFISFTTIVIVLSIIFVKKEIKKWIYTLFLFILFSIAANFAINLVTPAGLGAARMMFCLGALIGNIYILVYANTNIIQNKNIIMVTVLCIYVLSILANNVFIINKHKQVEKLAKNECEEISSFINEYETQSGIKLKKIAVYQDSNVTYFYNNIDNFSALCIRPLSVEWSDNGCINYYCNTKLIEIKPDEKIYNSYFKDKNWNKIKREQFIFVDDVMHYCIY